MAARPPRPPRGFLAGIASAPNKKKKKKRQQRQRTVLVDGEPCRVKSGPTVITKRSLVEGEPMQRFEEYLLEDGRYHRVVLGAAVKPRYVVEQESGISHLVPWVFSGAKGRWQKFKEEGGGEAKVGGGAVGTQRLLRELRLVTYNVWFDKLHQAARARALMEIVRGCDPDVVCLQVRGDPSLVGL